MTYSEFQKLEFVPFPYYSRHLVGRLVVLSRIENIKSFYDFLFYYENDKDRWTGNKAYFLFIWVWLKIEMSQAIMSIHNNYSKITILSVCLRRKEPFFCRLDSRWSGNLHLGRWSSLQHQQRRVHKLDSTSQFCTGPSESVQSSHLQRLFGD